MSTARVLIGAAACACVVVAPALRTDAATICVSPTKAGCETTIQAAVDIATGADMIIVEKGRYDENVVVPSGLDGLQLVGKGGVLDGDLPNTGAALTIASGNVMVSGLHIQNGQTYGIAVTPAVNNVTISKVVIRSSADACIMLEGDDHLVENSTIEGCQQGSTDAGVGVRATGHDIVVRRSKFLRLQDDAVRIVGDRPVVEKNKFTSLAGDAVALTGANAVASGNSCQSISADCIDIDGTNPTATNNKAKNIDARLVDINCGSGPCTGGLVSRNKVKFCASSQGLDADTDGGLVVEDNDVRHCDEGIDVGGNGAIVRRNRVRDGGSDFRDACVEISGTNHIVEDNEVEDCAGGGFDVQGDGHTLTGNEATGTQGDGFNIQTGTLTTLASNVAIDNLGVGFAVDLGVTSATLTGNAGFGNREDVCDAGTGTIDGGGNSFPTVFDPMGGDCPTED